jgi:hypothetical protein
VQFKALEDLANCLEALAHLLYRRNSHKLQSDLLGLAQVLHMEIKTLA